MSEPTPPQPVRRHRSDHLDDSAARHFFAQVRQIEQHKKAAKEGLEQALATITKAIREHWSTDGGTRLRQIIWSLWNGHTLVSLFQVLGGLDYELARAVAKVLEVFALGAVDDDKYLEAKRVLVSSYWV